MSLNYYTDKPEILARRFVTKFFYQLLVHSKNDTIRIFVLTAIYKQQINYINFIFNTYCIKRKNKF